MDVGLRWRLFQITLFSYKIMPCTYVLKPPQHTKTKHFVGHTPFNTSMLRIKTLTFLKFTLNMSKSELNPSLDIFVQIGIGDHYPTILQLPAIFDELKQR